VRKEKNDSVVFDRMMGKRDVEGGGRKGRCLRMRLQKRAKKRFRRGWERRKRRMVGEIRR
jgi:hypothetical protein